jgi:hypothetical protein
MSKAVAKNLEKQSKQNFESKNIWESANNYLNNGDG